MNISRISDKRLELALRLISYEVRATRGIQTWRTQKRSSAAAALFLAKACDARAKLLPLLHEAVTLRDIELILRIEKGFLTEELAYLAKRPRKVASLNMALDQLDAAMNLLPIIRRKSGYSADLYFTLARNRIYGMPKDEAQQFFISHITRLHNLDGGRFEDTEDELLDARIDNIKKAQELYTELQQQALAPHEVREERALYLVS